MSSFIAELQVAVKAGAPSETVNALCRAWAVVPSTRVAMLVRALSHRVSAEPLPGANQDARERAWLSLAQTATSDDLPTLLATPWSKKPRDAVKRLEVLAKLGPDPRIVGALLELDTGARYPTGVGHTFWRDAYSLLLRWGSAEAAARIPRDLRALPDASPWSGRRFITIFEPLNVEWQDRWPSDPVLEPEAVALLERLESRLAPQQHLNVELLTSVYARPDDDTTRLVLADALTEQGDPRGDFISLQFAHARGELPMGERERMQRMLRASGRLWLDGLHTQVAPSSVFHKGFAHEVRISTRLPDAGLPAWSVVEIVDAAAIATSLSEFLSHANTQRVHTLRSLRGTTLQELARKGSARQFQLLEVGFLGGRDVASPAWSVDTLRLLSPVDESTWWLVGSSGRIKAKRIELQVTGSFERVGTVLKELEAHAPDVEVVTFAARPSSWPLAWRGDWQLEFTRVNGVFERARVSLHGAFLDGLDVALASLDKEQLTTLMVDASVKRGPAWRDETRAFVLNAVTTQRYLEVPNVELLKPLRLPPSPVVYEGT